MKKTFGLLVSAALTFATVAILSTAAPASAADACAGTGVANTGARLFYPGLGSAKSTSFGFSLTTGACASGGGLSANGNITGPLGGAHCGLSTGSGLTNTNKAFTYVGVGSLLVVSGGIVGVVNATPDATTGHSCATSGASRFLITGAGVTP